MSDRIPVFELHIRPMFRLIDREHMLPHKIGSESVDLWDYDFVAAHAAKIRDELRNSSPMPTRATGGPWPEEWIGLFERWMATGHHRLSLLSGSNYALEKMGFNYVLSCEVELPDIQSRSWFDIVEPEIANRVHRLVLEPTVPAPNPPPPPFRTKVRERFSTTETISGVTVIDANGSRLVSLPSAS